jgi:hypothetical protein
MLHCYRKFSPEMAIVNTKLSQNGARGVPVRMRNDPLSGHNNKSAANLNGATAVDVKMT